MLKIIYLIQLFISMCEYLPASVKYATQSLWKAKTITLAKTWPSETGCVTQWNTWHSEKLRDAARINLTQRNTLMKLNTRKPATWRSENGTVRGENTLRYDSKWHCENITLCGEKYVTLRQDYIVSKMSGNMDLSLWRHCLVSAIFVHIESEATNVTSPVIHDKMLWEVAYPFRNLNGWNVQVLEWISFISHFIMNVITYPYWD